MRHAEEIRVLREHPCRSHEADVFLLEYLGQSFVECTEQHLNLWWKANLRF